MDPFSPTSAEILGFLQHVIDSTDALYGAFNSHRSALAFILRGDLGTDKALSNVS